MHLDQTKSDETALVPNTFLAKIFLFIKQSCNLFKKYIATYTHKEIM